MDGITVMPTEQQERYTDIAIELLHEALSKAGYKPVTNQKAAAAIRKYFNVDITEKNCLLHRYGIHRYATKSRKKSPKRLVILPRKKPKKLPKKAAMPN